MNDDAREHYEAAGADLSEKLTFDDLDEGDEVVFKKSDGSGLRTATVTGFETAGYGSKLILDGDIRVLESELHDPADKGGLPQVAALDEDQ